MSIPVLKNDFLPRAVMKSFQQVLDSILNYIIMLNVFLSSFGSSEPVEQGYVPRHLWIAGAHLVAMM